MRYFLAAAILAALPAAAQAASPVSLPRLAPGEVLLETDGYAVVQTPATSATITTTLYGRGATQAEAVRALQAEVEAFTAAAREAGAGASDIRVEMEAGTSGGLRTFDVDAVSDVSEGEAQSRCVAQASATARVRDVARARALHVRFGGGGDAVMLGYGGPEYHLDDDSVARREARVQAIASARADAEAYAAAAGMRIVRILRITDRAGLDFTQMLVTERGAAARLGPRFGRADEPIVETVAIVGVDYVLAPR
jgi:uncharacterized protein YggE